MKWEGAKWGTEKWGAEKWGEGNSGEVACGEIASEHEWVSSGDANQADRLRTKKKDADVRGEIGDLKGRKQCEIVFW